MPRGTAKEKKDIVAALPEHCFWVHEGPILSDLRELRASLKKVVSSEQFSHHVDEKHE